MFEYKYIVEKDDFASAGKVSSQIKQTLKQLGIPTEILRRMAIACYEAEINMIIHSYGGNIYLVIEDDGAINMTFHDVGPGIENLEKALEPGFSTASAKAREFGFGAGMGLPNIKRVSDRFEIQSSKEGTILMIGYDL